MCRNAGLSGQPSLRADGDSCEARCGTGVHSRSHRFGRYRASCRLGGTLGSLLREGVLDIADPPTHESGLWTGMACGRQDAGPCVFEVFVQIDSALPIAIGEAAGGGGS